MGNDSFVRISKEKKEKWAVKIFYENKGEEINEAELKSDIENSPIDVFYKDSYFQVKYFPAEAEEVDGRLRGGEDNVVSKQNKNSKGRFFNVSGMEPVPQMDLEMNFKEMKEQIEKIIEKAEYKCPKQSNIILLIYNGHVAQDVLEVAIKDIKVSPSNFKEIYLLTFGRNLKIT